jgi:hypothetical protein
MLCKGCKRSEREIHIGCPRPDVVYYPITVAFDVTIPHSKVTIVEYVFDCLNLKS